MYNHLLNDTVTVASKTGVGNDGDPTFSAQATMAARVEYGTRRVYGSAGEERQCEAIVITAAEIPSGSRVWLPDATTTDTSQAKIPIVVKRASTPWAGVTLYETYF